MLVVNMTSGRTIGVETGDGYPDLTRDGGGGACGTGGIGSA